MKARWYFSFAILVIFFPWQVFAAAPEGSLVKVACPDGALVSHPCKAVYFYGHDGKRHAFPNERIYFTWYADFSDVRIVSASEMASITLGQNVTYRPGSKLVKFITDPKTYAVALGGELRWVTSESVASALYGPSWNTEVDDISDAFFTNYRFGDAINSSADFSPSEELAVAMSVDDDLPATHRSVSVATPNGTFTIELIKLQTNRFRMVTDAAETSDCTNGCAVKSLQEYANVNGASIAMNGTYFCPPEYADCAAKTNTFLWPFFDSPSKTMLNDSSLAVHQGPMLTQGSDGIFRFYHRTKDLGSVSAFESSNGTTLNAAIANYPSLIEGGAVVVNTEPKLDNGMKTVKGTRGGIGIDERFVYMVIARSATVLDLTEIFLALGASDAMNLDGGGSSAMLFNSTYEVGPGRELPNAILFLPR